MDSWKTLCGSYEQSQTINAIMNEFPHWEFKRCGNKKLARVKQYCDDMGMGVVLHGSRGEGVVLFTNNNNQPIAISFPLFYENGHTVFGNYIAVRRKPDCPYPYHESERTLQDTLQNVKLVS